MFCDLPGLQEIRAVEVSDILRARDERVERQNAFLKKYASPLISFTMNIAGSIKYDPQIHAAYCEGVKAILRQLERMGIVPLDFVEKVSFTGCEALWAVRTDAVRLKASMCAIEEADELGRLFDIDVIDSEGNHLTRGSERRCLICGQPVRSCARSRAHSAEQLYQKASEIIAGHFRTQRIRKIGELAQKALLYEAATTPKPGLVDCENSGSHTDMDLFSFVNSACALRSYFEECALMGMEGGSFEQLQYAGLQAEDRMLEAAKVNTHKGAIFALGILCWAVGSCGMKSSLDEILQQAAEMGKRALGQMKSGCRSETGGERQFMQYGLTGARGEAASGFRTVREIALPALEQAISEGNSIPDAGLHALIALISKVQDSNVIRRAGMEGQQWTTEQAKRLLERKFSKQDLRMMNERFVANNISPGGSADLLAAAYFLYFIKKEIDPS